MTLTCKSILALTALAGLSLAAAPSASAQGLDGSQVTGNLTFEGVIAGNGFDPANNHVPVGFENMTAGTTVPVSETQVEFGFQDQYNLDTADFGANTLTLTDTSQYNGAVGATYTFTDPAFATATLRTNTFGADFSYSLVNDTLTITTPDNYVYNPNVRTATFDITANPVPEASSVVSFGLLLALGLGAALVARRKSAKA